MIFFKRAKIKRLTKKLKVLQQYRVHNPASPAAIKKEMTMYHQLAKIYLALKGNKHFPYADELVLACYRASASIDDSEAQYLVAKALINKGLFRDGLQRDGLLASPSNEREMQQHFQEAFAYLQAAQKLNHVQAKRLYGVCFVNGWGMPVDQNKGFELIGESIEQEGTWNNVAQIFAGLGLKPEVLSAFMKFRK